MRISETEKKSIVNVFNKFKMNGAKIYLFGSRTDDSKRGGDIDLLITFDQQEDLVKFARLDFLIDLKKNLGDRKIDITMAHKSELAKDPFLISILKSAILL